MKHLTSMLILYFLIFCHAIGQDINKAQTIQDQDFIHEKIDTAFNGESIAKIRFRNLKNNTEYYNSFESEGKLITGYLINGYPAGKWKTFDANGKIISSLDFDTLKIGQEEIRKIANNLNYGLDTYEIAYFYPSEINPEFDLGQLDLENHWIIRRWYHDNYYTESEGVSVNAVTGEIMPYVIQISTQPAYNERCYNEAKFPDGEQALQTFIVENSKYLIEKDGKNQVWVNFDVLSDGSIDNIETGFANTGDFKREAARLVKSMPKWIPAIHDEKPIKCRQRISIDFK